MKLNHLNLTVSDVPSAHAFLETHFGLEPAFDATQSDTIAVLKDDNGLLLTLMNLQNEDEVSYPGMFHVGFVQDSRAEVDGIYQRLSDAGFKAKPAHEFHGAYTFYVKAPGGFTVEVLSW